MPEFSMEIAPLVREDRSERNIFAWVDSELIWADK